ncbi:MAG: hypothetical protein R3350_02785 [Saprospiraceae bacterium]|nr:hypothetical protein [Saprospiraceae bacterium]
MKKILILAGILGAIGAGIAFYLYNMPHENIQRADADYEMTAAELFRAFNEDEAAANDKYLDEIIEVSGTIQGVQKKDGDIISVTLQSEGMFGVVCELDQQIEHPKRDFESGETATFKGKCTGKLMDVVLTRCVEVK